MHNLELSSSDMFVLGVHCAVLKCKIFTRKHLTLSPLFRIMTSENKKNKEASMKDYDSLLLELWERVQRLESEVEALKRARVGEYPLEGEKTLDVGESPALKKKDTTKYVFQENTYGKSRLVLAVVKAYVKANPRVTCSELGNIFEVGLQGTFGVVIKKEYAIRRCADPEKRFFMKPEEEIRLIDGTMCVCTQWGKENINNFINKAKRLGFSISER